MQAVLIVMPIFILIVIGWSLRHKKWLSPQTVKENNFFLYWLAIPATLLRGILGADTSSLKSFSFCVAVWLPYIITLAAVWLTTRRKSAADRFPELALCAIRSNHFFVGVPIVTLAMGQRGFEAAVLILAFSLVAMQLFSIGGAQLAMFGTVSWKSLRRTCVQLFKNPLFLTCLLSLLLVSAGLNSLPAWLDAALAMLADVSTGLALVGLGAGIDFSNVLKAAASLWRILLFKLAVCPAVTYVIFKCFGLPSDMVQAGVLLAAMPIAVNSAIIAQEMGMDREYCAMAVAVTTLCSLLTLPLLIRLLGLV